ncbi:hypothetical protein PF011_g9702 [Phytophthora fragariae]|uniref:Cyclic nucleotide-binding domain-containing protein n=1 Tax=Phytophthora fragariae TaxID=53985 RepID=A0A6A3KYS3_9STRA|nr:hypothetical protein PF011_g9702 [Phytophthora fragariae]
MVKVHQRSQWSKDSDRLSWLMSMGRKSVGRVHSPLSLHTRLAHLLAEDLQDAFDPNANAVQLWDHVLLLSLVLEAFLVPYVLAFQSASMEIVSVAFVLVGLCEGVFAVDLYVQAHTGYYRGGDLIRDKKLTTRRYVHSFQFALDMRYYTDTESNDREASRLLCPSIVSDIQVELLKPMIAQIAVFSGCSDQFIAAVAGLLEMIALPSQTTLFSAGDYGDAIYIVHSGVLAIVVQSVTVRDIRKGSCFGELSLFSSLPRTATVMSMTYVILYKLSRFHCDRLLEGYPESAFLIVGHVQSVLTQLKSAEVMDESKPAASSPTKTSDNISPRAGVRRASVEAAFVAGASAVLKLLSRKVRRPSAPKRVLSWLGKRNLVSPAPQPDTHNDDGQPTRKSGAETQEERTTQGTDQDTRRTAINPYNLKQDTRTQEKNGVWRLLLLAKCIDQHSELRRWWLLLLLLNIWYSWLMIPVQIVFPLWQRPSWLVQAVDGVSNAGFLLSVAMNLNLSFVVDSEQILDTKRSAQRYLNGSFVFDLLCALPCEYADMTRYGLLRLPRLLSVYHLRSHLNEVSNFIPFTSRRQLMLLGATLFMMFHVVTCVHFGISYLEGFNPSEEEEAWISPVHLCLRRLNATHLESCNGTVFDENTDQKTLHAITVWGYSRSLYYAVGVLASPGKSVEPSGTVQSVAALVLMLSGFLFTAVVVDNVQKRFTASAYEQKAFIATSTRIQLFLRQQNAPLVIHHRVKSFLDYWWSSHRGAVIGELLADLPRSIRLNLLSCICFPVLQTLALLQGVRPVLDKLEEVMAENAKFILYGQGQIVYRYGDYVTGIFFLLEGDVCVVENGMTARQVPRGFCFGTAALTGQDDEGYMEHVSASSGCILLLVSRDELKAMELIFPGFKEALLTLETRLLRNKRTSVSLQSQTDATVLQESKAGRLQRLFRGMKHAVTSVHDPDSLFITAWEVWIFVVMTVQWALVVFQACFPLAEKHRHADGLMVFLEFSFLLDMLIRSRLGFYEFGNKILDQKRIKRKYFRSYTFVIDVGALLPLYVVNWSLPAQKRLNIVNVNKLLRLLKVPKQLQKLEKRYLKHTTELRLFKLLYYTFMLSHFLGCTWFNFASKQAMTNDEPTAFGDNLWLPSTHLENGSLVLQYTASLYWSFGLMSASSEPEFPKTTGQCTFSAFTMTFGFFLCAYVIGNFTDIIELNSAETRWFNAKMRAVRHMLRHFRVPDDLQQRVETFLLFKRYHTVTQENLLVHYLSPSLLTDIRLIHLKPMLERVEFLTGMEGSITRMLVSQFTQVLISRGEYVCRFGERASDMFFIFAGVLDVLLPSGNPDNVGSIAGANWSDRINVHRRGSHSSIQVGPAATDITSADLLKKPQERYYKVNELKDGEYFGENGLFTNGVRNAYVQAQSSCILYKLSRESMELVFTRYPGWKRKVLSIASIHREKNRLLLQSREEQRRGLTTATGFVLSQTDLMNERAERLKEKMDRSRWTRTHSLRTSLTHLPRIITPYQLAIDPMDRLTITTTILNILALVCEVAFVVDVWFSWHVKESTTTMELYEQSLANVYTKDRMIYDFVAAIPFYGFLTVFNCSPRLKLLRCIKMLNLVGYLDELSRSTVANELTRFGHVWLLYLLVIYWAACAYLVVAMEIGFGSEWESWLPSKVLEISDPQNPSSAQLTLRFLRGFFFATTAFVKKARNIAPESASAYAFQITMSFVGLLTMAFVIAELASLFISRSSLEVGVRKNHIAVKLYLERARVSDNLKARTCAFMATLWASHAGLNYDELFADMPQEIRSACVLHASKIPLNWFVMKVITPICGDVNVNVEALTLSVAQQLHFEAYPRDEDVITEGRILHAMYFVTKGFLNMQSTSLLDRPVGLRDGSYFGERGLLGCTISAYTVTTARACDLFSLSSEAFTQVLRKHEFSSLALDVCTGAYKHLKAKRAPDCSRIDMEERWGAALLDAVQDLRSHATVFQIPSGEESAEKTPNRMRQSTERQTTAEQDERIFTPSTRNGDTLVALQAISETLDTAQSCFEAFMPLLYIMLPTDPLDWNTSFGKA